MTRPRAGRGSGPPGAAEVWTADPRLASVAREIMREEAPVQGRGLRRAAGSAVADERLGKEAAERRL